MSLEKQVTIDKVEFVGEFRSMQVRTKTSVLENGESISDSFHRSVYDIETGIENLPEELQPYATGVWTDELLAAQQAAQEQFHLEHGIETE
jgi:hypothetical protein